MIIIVTWEWIQWPAELNENKFVPEQTCISTYSKWFMTNDVAPNSTVVLSMRMCCYLFTQKYVN